ncbi:MAG: hypothetical protein JWO46_942 [Nocardioidaceae bacterium]|nr:hypothetical protein [Nocardioidaceae bacterium]
MDVALKKGAVLLFVVFVGYYMFTDPSGLATFAKEGSSALWDALQQLFTALISFLDTMFS